MTSPECCGHCINYLQPPNRDYVGAYVKAALVSRRLTPPRTPVVSSIDERDRRVQRAFQKCIGSVDPRSDVRRAAPGSATRVIRTDGAAASVSALAHRRARVAFQRGARIRIVRGRAWPHSDCATNGRPTASTMSAVSHEPPCAWASALRTGGAHDVGVNRARDQLVRVRAGRAAGSPGGVITAHHVHVAARFGVVDCRCSGGHA